MGGWSVGIDGFCLLYLNMFGFTHKWKQDVQRGASVRLLLSVTQK